MVCAVSIYCYPLALPTPLLDPSEGLHAAISQEMVENGDFVTPRLRGVPFLDKPSLFFAAQGLSLATFGMNEAAVRLPGFIFALLGAITTAVLASRLFDRSTGIVTLLVSLTLVGPLALAQTAVHDVALVPWTNLLLLCWWEADSSDSMGRRIGLTLAAALLVALALLTKGLIGIAIISVGYFLFAVISRRISLLLVIRFAAGLVLGALLASPWFIAMEYRVPGYLHYYFVERHIGGFTTASQLHGGEPWYYYLPIISVGALPAAIYLLPGLWQTWTDRRECIRSDATAILFLLCWLAGGLFFLSTAGSKLITYALPLFPSLAILSGYYLKRFLYGELSPQIDFIFNKMFQSSYAMACIAPVIALVAIDLYNGARSPALAYVIALLAGASVFTALILAHRGNRPAAFAVGSLWFALFFISMMTWPLQTLAEQYSQRSLGRQLASRAEFPQKLVVVGNRVASVTFYLTPEQRRQLKPDQIITAGPGEVARWSAIPDDWAIAITDKALTEAHSPLVRWLADATPAVGQFHLVEDPQTLVGSHSRPFVHRPASLLNSASTAGDDKLR
ncbi:MAG: glycosyltransferase family 39 protein [Pirellulales bacterium]